MWWLLETSVREAMEQAQKLGAAPTAEQQAKHEANYALSEDGGGSRIMTTAGASAEISIKGVLTKAPSFLAFLFGGGNTTYPEIVSALAQAEQDDTVESVTLAIDSPGGHFDGLFDTLAAIQGVTKPVTAKISNLGASAAYAIATQADTVIAANRAARIGSVGVVATFDVSDNEVFITSTDAPKKRPDVTTKAGRAMVREELDAMHEIFADAIAEGMGVSVDTVNAEFGQGATLLAGEALKRGMIDSIADTPLKAVKTAKKTTARKGGNQPEAGLMDLNELRTQHPDVYTAAMELGATQERDRVTAHLTMGEASGDTKTAFAAIKDGSEMTATLLATYSAASMRRNDIAARDDDDDNAGDNAGGDNDQDDDGGAVAALVESRLGTEV